MSWEAWFTLGIIGLGIMALIREVLAPDLIFLGLLALLLAAGIVTPEEALVGFVLLVADADEVVDEPGLQLVEGGGIRAEQ